ncbi:PKD repeat protein [Methanolinea mesophila]|uniref:PKD domain-containing protein n=1 Tax=Methanolinea mesophila TaxID=547055 RepID=UPI001AE55F32|nr:PKD domain-containing protein [Methanolinea mesophila]MBP1928149.1 PKD repeat protein [Methanolinea mesophila]
MMKSINFATFLLVLALAALAGTASAFTLSGENASVGAPGGTATIALFLDEAPAGLSGFNISVSLADPAVGEIMSVSFPSWVTMSDNTTFPADTVWIKSLDTGPGDYGNVAPGATDIPMGTLALRGDAAGTTAVVLSIVQMSDDEGMNMTPAIAPLSFTVNGPPVAQFSANLTAGAAPLTVLFSDASTGNPVSWSWSFGDGGSSTEQDPVHTYLVPGNYTVTLTVTNAAGSDNEEKTGYISVTAALPDPPVVNFTADNRSGPAPLVVHFTDLSTNGPASWAWDFGDGTTSGDQDPAHTYADPGTYSVTLTASNAGGSGDDEKQGYITVTAPLPDPPVVNFVGDNRSGPAPLVVHFTDQSTNNPTAWAWDFGNDGTVDSTEQNPTYTFTVPGTYQVNLTASNAGGSGSRLKGNYIQVTVPGSTDPVVDFSADSRTGTAPFTVQFTDASVTDPTAWAWDFENDGTVDSSLRNPVHTYPDPGTYQVKLTVTNASGTASRLKADFITVNPPVTAPDADFTAAPLSGDAPLEVQFTDQSTGAGTWNWDFGDGTTSTEQDPVHTYGLPGNYTVRLTVANGGGTDTEVKSGYITVSLPPDQVITSIVVVPDTALMVPGESLQFAATAYDHDGGTVPYSGFAWSSSNATVGTVNSTGYFRAQAPGSATITASSGDVTGSANVHVVAAPANGASFTANPDTGRAPCIVRFTDTSSATGVTGREWDFGDGTTSDAINPTHIYRKAGQYVVILRLFSEIGTDTATGTVLVTGSGSTGPVSSITARFSANPMAGKAPLEVRFTDRSTGAETWTWDFGDGTTSTEENPVHVFTGPGTYRVTLSVTGEGGSASTTGSVMVIGGSSTPGPVLKAQFSASPMSGRAPLEVTFTDRSAGAETWTWDFGDGTTSTEQDPVHLFTATGIHRVTLTVTHGDELAASTAFIMVMSGASGPVLPATAQVTASPMTGRAPLEVRFTDRSAGAETWYWDFGDGTTSTEQDPVHTFAMKGTYKVVVQVNTGNAVEEATKTIWVF